MNKKLQVFKYIFADTFAAVAAWTLFYSFRKLYIESEKFGTTVPLIFDRQFFKGLLIISVFWLLLYILTGTYKNIYQIALTRSWPNPDDLYHRCDHAFLYFAAGR